MYLVAIVGLAVLATSTGFVGTATAAAGNTAPDCSGVSYADGDNDGKLDVDSVDRLQCIENKGLGKDYELTSDINASGTSKWNGGNGFDPIGDSGSQFTGTFDGADHTISDLSIDRGGTDNIGLFGEVDGGTIENVGVENADITGNTVVGGLVGRNFGTVTESYATGNVSGDSAVGGLVGYNSGTINDSYATANVSGDNYFVGGLVGQNAATVGESYATGNVSGSSYVGGLVGDNVGDVTESYATGNVSGTGYVGGLVGSNSGTVTDSYWDKGTTNQSDAIGEGSGSGLIGFGSTSDTTPAPEMTGGDAPTNMSAFAFPDGAGTWHATNAYPALAWQDTDPFYGLTIDSTTSPVGVADTLDVTATVTNWATDGSQQSITLTDTDFTDSQQDSSAVTLASGDSQQLTLSWETSPSTSTGTGDVSVASENETATQSVTVSLYAGGDGSTDNPYEIANWYHLNNTRENLDAEFILTAGLDSNTAGYDDVASSSANGGNGFDPIGDDSSRFTGTFNGTGHTISNLSIDRGGTFDVGLFGYVNGGIIENVGVKNADITGKERVGGLVGKNFGTVSNSYATGNVYGDKEVGGLVGFNFGNTTASYATSDVSGTGNDLGGLVGSNVGNTSGSYATGNVSGTGMKNVGGLAGVSEGEITESNATGIVSGNNLVGGLVGVNTGTVTESYATGNVSGTGDVVGGLVARNFGATVTKSYATGSVTGIKGVGGLVGINSGISSAEVSESYAAGSVTGTDDVGGLVGVNNRTVSDSYWDTARTNQSDGVGRDAGGTATNMVGLTTPEMTGDRAAGNMGPFDFSSTWQTTGDDGSVDDYGVFYSTLQNNTQQPAPSATLYAGGDGSAGAPYEIANWYHLDNVRENLDANFTLTANLNKTTAGYDFVSNSTANGGDGFDPIWETGSQFTGTFDGAGHTISGLRIARPGAPDEMDGTDAALIATLASGGVVSDITLVDAEITAGDGGNSSTDTEATAGDGGDAAGLVATNNGTITDSAVTQTTITAGAGGDVKPDSLTKTNTDHTGGTGGHTGVITAINNGHVSASSTSNVTVTAGPGGKSNADEDGSNGGTAGGLVGTNTHRITESFSTNATVTAGAGGAADHDRPQTAPNGGAGGPAGGLVGQNTGTIDASFAVNTTAAGGGGGQGGDGTSGGNGGAGGAAGGLVGVNDGTVTETYAAVVTLTGGDGGPAGTGSPGKDGETGGVLGVNTDSVTDSYWDEKATATTVGVGNTADDGVAGLQTVEIQRFAPLANMDGFSFESPETWLVTSGYPALAWESVTELTVDTVEATSPTGDEDESGTITVTAKESGTDTGEGVTIEVVSDDGLDGFADDDTKVTDANGEVTFTFDEPDDGTYSPEFAWADDTSVSTTPTVTVQNAPEVASITRASGESNPTNADSVDFAVTFDGATSGLSVPKDDFVLTGDSGVTSGASIQSPTGSGDTGTVTVTGVSGDGTLGLKINDNDNIQNDNGVPLGGVGTSGSADGSYSSGESFTIDNTSPGFDTSTSASLNEESTASDFLNVDAGDDGTPGSEVSDYSLASGAGTDASAFSIDSATGEISLDSELDHESPTDDDGNSDYELTVMATDDADNTDTQDITITIGDVDETPIFTSGTSSNIAEDRRDNTNVIDINANVGGSADAGIDSYQFTGGNGDNAFAIDSSGQITINDASKLDHEVSASRRVTVKASEGAESATETINIGITDVDETPSFAGVGDQTVYESSGAGTNVIDIDADVNANGATPADTGVSYALTSGNDDVANDGGGAFAIDSSGQITINDVDDIDESAQSSFTLRVEASEGSQSNTQDVTITVTDDVSPSFEYASSTPADGATDHAPSEDINLKFNEDVTLGSGDIKIVNDGDDSSTNTLDVTSGDVTVSGSTVTLSPASNLEADTAYHVEILSGVIYDRFSNPAAAVTNYNFQTADTDPSFTQGTSTSLTIDEDGSADLKNALKVKDISPSDTLTWTVDSGPSNGALSGIDGKTLGISGSASPHTLGTSPTYTPDADFNSGDSFDVTISDTKPGLSTDTITVDVTVEAVNDAPTLSVSTSDLTFTEDEAAVTVFTSASTFTVEEGQQVERLDFTVSNVADGNNERLTVDGSSVALTDGTSVSTNNNGLTAGVSVSGSTATVTVDGGPFSESTANTIIDNLAYENTDDAPTTGSGRIITITKLVDDGGTTSGGDDTTTPSDFGTVSLTAVNDAPSITIGSDQTTNADTTEQTVTDFATRFDPGGGESQGISDFIVTNDDNTLFAKQPDISNDGDLTYTPADSVDRTATVSVQVVDDGGTTNGGEDTSSTKTFDINVDTEAPSFYSVSNPSMDENTVNALDVNADDGSGTDTGVTYSLVGGADQSAFSIDSNTGELSFDSAPNYENPTDSNIDNSYVVDVQADDGVGNTNTQTVTVDVTDVNESPTAPDDSSQSTDEDSTVSVADGDAADLLTLASDPDAGDTLSFDTIDDTSFSSGTPVTLGSGATVTVDSDGSWTYDPNGQYESFDSADSTTDTFTYTVADSNDDTAQGTVTVSIAGVNDAPTAISLSSASVDQSSGTNAVVGRLSAADVDDNSHTFSLVSGGGDGDNAEFNVDSGDLRADDAGSLAEGDYDVRLEADDGSGGTYEKAVTISVTDDIAPTITSSTPADDATGVSETTDITITFSEDVVFGSGSVILREDDGGFSNSETFDVSTDTGGGDGTVSISGRNLTITPTSEFTSSTEYAVQIDAGTLTDTAASPNDFGGIGDNATVNFTTTDSMPPTASVGPDATVGEGESVSFDGTGSTDNVGIVSHDWDFDDGDTAIGATTTHTFDNAGTYEVELTVADALNNEATAIRTITVESTGGGGDDSSGGSSAPADTDDGQPSADEDTTHVVTGTRSDDGTASFNVADSGGYGSITLDLRGTATDDSQSAAGSDGNDADDGVDTDTVVVDRLSITPTESATREFELSVRTWSADSIEPGNETDDAGTVVTAPANQGRANYSSRTDTRAFLNITGSVPVGYVEVTHTNPDTDIENVTFRFRIQKVYLDERDVAPSTVALYRNETDGWSHLPTEDVGSNGSYYLFESVSPGLSLFAIGSSGPTFVIERASGPADTLTISEPVTVDATVRNLGRAAGAYTAELRSNGTVVAAREVELAPNSTRTVSLSFTPADPGEYTLTVGTVVAGTVSVQSDEVLNASTPAPTEQANPQQTPGTTGESTQPAGDNGDTESATDASGPGFGVAVAFGVLLTVVIVLARRQS
ncbi:hypothetical protein DP106_04615 [Halonotius pteroides]|uniref:Cadherin domain-containing protein n=1 Tax=Halonotius pteroides TaxID=268735 RepID=A0A3A6QFE2_9EURY|nr:hypothetical protein DP106_04615 [Halonotius pteroides]